MKRDCCTTFYCFDGHNKCFIRLAVIESPGLCNLLLPKLRELYPDNLYKIAGVQPHKIAQKFDAQGYSTIILDKA